LTARRLARSTKQPADVVTALFWFQALLFLVPSVYVIRGTGAIGSPAIVIGILMFGLWVLARIVPGSGLDLRAQPIRVVILLFAASVLVTYATANQAPLPADEVNGADRGILLIAAAAGITLLTADGVSRLERLQLLLRRFADFASFIAVVGIVQYVARRDLVSPLFRPLVFLSENRTGDFGGIYRIGNDLVRPVGTAIHPIEFSVVLAMALPLAAHFALQDKERHGIGRWWKALAIVLAVAMSQSRSGIVTLAVAAIIVLPAWPGTALRSLFKLAPVLVASMRLVFPGLLGTVRNLFLNFSSDPSVTSRTEDYERVTAYIQQHPWFGRGFGTFLPHKYLLVDNQYLLGTVEFGYIGIGFLSLLLVVAIVVSGMASRWALTDVDRLLARSLMAAIAGGAVAMATFDYLSFPMASGTLFLLLGAAGALWRLLRDEARAAGVARPLRRRERRSKCHSEETTAPYLATRSLGVEP
jgi:polysaccharide biosynthesis protein PslJ